MRRYTSSAYCHLLADLVGYFGNFSYDKDPSLNISKKYRLQRLQAVNFEYAAKNPQLPSEQFYGAWLRMRLPILTQVQPFSRMPADWVNTMRVFIVAISLKHVMTILRLQTFLMMVAMKMCVTKTVIRILNMFTLELHLTTNMS